MSATAPPLDLVSQAEAADLLGLSRQRVTQLVEEGRAPRPAGKLRRGFVWERADVERWAEERRNGHEAGLS